ncbi:hypothetical protein VTN49DRAFT_3148 [Thermomyces lanuginosus]|uniref:uncharacterized protein n=1 Tax=Thermomyces lanuginosus TaxID=5541 RepID=UPI0037430890
MTLSPASSSARPNDSNDLRNPMTTRVPRRLSGQTISDQSGRDSTAEIINTDDAGFAATEEINEIKRYEDFTTIDWVQDAVQEQRRRRARRREGADFWDKEGAFGWRRKVREAYDAGQTWLVVTIVGAIIGLNAAFLNIVTEWLSDIKLGYCTTAFYLNEQFCCWGADGECPEWKRWGSNAYANYIVYFIFAVLFAFTSAFLVKSIATYAAGSGISEIKCIIAGFVMKGFLGPRTLLIKSIGLPLSIASGLSVGKEGPSVHYAVCTGNVVSKFFKKYRRNAAKMREILTATAGAGVAVAFGSPIGGVLFSLEEMATYFPLKTLWRSYYCALVATGVLAAMNPFRTGQLVMFQVSYDRTWHFFELIFFIIIGVFGGLYGAFVIKWNLRAQAFRKKYLSSYPVTEATILAGLTALLCYPNMFLRINMTQMMEVLFQECGDDERTNYGGICEAKNRWSMVFSLFIATLLRIVLVIISYGCKVPAGIFVPSMAIGATFGRFVGILVQALHESFPDSEFFSACEPDVPCISPGTYAFLGAAAALSGIMHLTVSVVVIMFELTGALTYILPTMIVVGVTKAVGEAFGKGGIADRMIWFNGFPFLDNKEDHIFNVPVSRVMTTNPVSLPASGMTLREVETLLSEKEFQGFPIVEKPNNRILVGYIGRTELKYAIDKARQSSLHSPSATCLFTKEAAAYFQSSPTTRAKTRHTPRTFEELEDAAGVQYVDFSPYVDHTPVSVHARLPLETTMELFKKMGPRVILVERRGRLMGLVTVKDCLKYQFKVESQEHMGSHSHAHNSSQWLEDRIWQFLQRIGRALQAPRRDGRAGGAPSSRYHRRRRHFGNDGHAGEGPLIGGEVDNTLELDERGR